MQAVVSNISAATRYCAVYGHPIRHSGSPAMQNSGIEALGLDWRYLAFNVHPDSLADAIRGAQNMHFVGLNLTVPHKQLAVGLVDELDSSAREWGAVNTIRFEGKDANGDWHSLAHPDSDGFHKLRSVGYNTDADAVVRACEEDLEIEIASSRILIVGVGGAGRVAALKVAASGCKCLFIVNRTQSKAESVREEIRSRFPGCEVIIGYPEERIDLLINGTSLGLKDGDSLPVDLSRISLSSVGAVYDMIYQPAETPLLRAAKAVGCKVSNGLGMLVYQGAKALEIWSEREAPVAAMRLALEAHIYGNADE